MITISISDMFDVPDFTLEERRRIDQYYKKMRARHDFRFKTTVRRVKLPPDHFRDDADKIRHCCAAAGVAGRSIYE